MSENTEGTKDMDNQEKLATQGTYNEEKQNKITAPFILYTTMRNTPPPPPHPTLSSNLLSVFSISL